MKIATKFHGELSIEKLARWSFPKGIPGLEDERQFVLLPIEGNDNFQVMQSVTSSAIALIVSNPYTLVDDYSFEIDEPTIELLSIKTQEEVMVLTVMTIKEPFESSTLNLQAPLIFNSKNHIAKQMILNDSRFEMRHVISDSSEKGVR